MNKAKKYYVNNDGNMIGYTRHYRFEKFEMTAEKFHAKLQIKKVGWLNNGFYFVLTKQNIIHAISFTIIIFKYKIETIIQPSNFFNL